MVLLEELGFRAEVLVDNMAAEEFPAPEQPDARDEDLASQPFMRHRYIESKSNVEFAVSILALDTHGLLKAWMDANKNNAVGFRVSIDGQTVQKGAFRRAGENCIVRGIINNTNNTIQKFQFAAISPKAIHEVQTKDLGTIQVHIHRAALIKPASDTPEVCGLAQGDEIALAEKALKGRALVHGASLAPTSHLQPDQLATRLTSNWEIRWDPRDEAVAIVRFMYRSKDALKQELIIPRTPSPERSPSPEAQTVDDLSLKEIRRLAQDRLSELRIGSPVTAKRAARLIKDEDEAEQPTRPLKYIRISGVRQAIDLTDDD